MVGDGSRRNHTIIMLAGTGAVISTLLAVVTNLAANAIPAALRRWTGDPYWIWVITAVFLAAFVVVTVAEKRVSVRGDNMARLAASGQETERNLYARYDTAVERLSAADTRNATAGARELAAVADDWPSGRQRCIDILCDHLRHPYSSDPTRADDQRRLRTVIIQVIRTRLTAGAPVPWWGHTFDLSKTYFDGGSFDGIALEGSTLSFVGAHLEGPGLSFEGLWARSGVLDLSEVRLRGATLSLNKTQLAGAAIRLDRVVVDGDSTITFKESSLRSGTISLDSADLSGLVDFEWSRLTTSLGDDESEPLVSLRGAVIRSGEVRFVSTTHRLENGPSVEAWLSMTQRFEFPTLVDLSDAVMEGGKLNYWLANWHAATERFDRLCMKGGEIAFTAITISLGTLSFKSSQIAGGRVTWDRANFGVGDDRRSQQDWLRALEAATPEELLQPYQYSHAFRPLGFVDFLDARMTGGTLSFLGAYMSYGLISFVGMGMTGGEVDCSEGHLGKGVFVLWRADIYRPAQATFGFSAPTLILDAGLARARNITRGLYQQVLVVSAMD